jgi:hypothetical protein
MGLWPCCPVQVRFTPLARRSETTRSLGPPRSAGSVCRMVRPILDLAVCIPDEPSHRTPPSHLKASELFETLPCESEVSIAQVWRCRTDFVRGVWIQVVGREKWGIEESIHLSRSHPDHQAHGVHPAFGNFRLGSYSGSGKIRMT